MCVGYKYVEGLKTGEQKETMGNSLTLTLA